jgi:hypothetical protein
MLFLTHPERQAGFRERFGDGRVCLIGMEDEGAVVDQLRPPIAQ